MELKPQAPPPPHSTSSKGCCFLDNFAACVSEEASSLFAFSLCQAPFHCALPERPFGCLFCHLLHLVSQARWEELLAKNRRDPWLELLAELEGSLAAKVWTLASTGCAEKQNVSKGLLSHHLLANNVCPCRHQRGTTSWPSSTHRRSCRWYPGRSIGIPRRTYEGEQPPEINRDWTEPKEKRARELPLKTPQECHGPEPRCKTWQK